jgi:hypothetical protein
MKLEDSYTRSCHWSSFRSKWIQPTSSYRISFTSALIISSHLHPHVPSGLSVKLCVHFSSLSGRGLDSHDLQHDWRVTRFWQQPETGNWRPRSSSQWVWTALARFLRKTILERHTSQQISGTTARRPCPFSTIYNKGTQRNCSINRSSISETGVSVKGKVVLVLN